jgi:hypothetical protein
MVDDLPVHLLAYMAPQDSMSDALRQLKRQASKEQDPDRLGELVAQMNELLDIIEGRLAELQGRKPPSD